MIVRYLLAGRLLLENVEAEPPRRGDEVGLGGRVYEVARLVRHMPDCPPDHVNAHLMLAEPEGNWPDGHP